MNSNLNFRWKGNSPELKKAQQFSLRNHRRRFLKIANACLNHMIEDADNGKLLISNGGNQATTEVQPMMYLRETDELPYVEDFDFPDYNSLIPPR